MREAIPAFVEHHESFQAFDESLQKEASVQVDEWEDMLKVWEVDHSRPNPYETGDIGTSPVSCICGTGLTLHRHQEDGQSQAEASSRGGPDGRQR